MCLRTKSKKPKIAKKDIICYKVLEVRDGKYYSPVMLFRYDLDVLYKSCGEPHVTYNGSRYEVDRGMFHAYTSKNTAYNSLLLVWRGRCVFPAIIPKGSKYYIGICNEICSDEIIICSKEPPQQLEESKWKKFINKYFKWSSKKNSLD